MWVLAVDKFVHTNPIALRKAKTLQSFGCSECNRVSPIKCPGVLHFYEREHYLEP